MNLSIAEIKQGWYDGTERYMLSMDARRGDKVKIKSPDHHSARGVVLDIRDNDLHIALVNGETIYRVEADVTNYSLAARRAWATLPSRPVGRPRSHEPTKKTVSVRMEVALWDELGDAVQRRLIPSREQAINKWVREQLDTLYAQKTPSDGSMHQEDAS